MENYWLVSIIILLGKRTEMEFGDPVTKHFLDNRLCKNENNGTIPGLYVAAALIQVNDKIVRDAEDKRLSGTVCIDLSITYDLVEKWATLGEAKGIQLSSYSYILVSNYLEGRSYKYKIDCTSSESEAGGPYGVPHGIILGSLHFNVNQNYLPEAPSKSETGLTTLYVYYKTFHIEAQAPINWKLKCYCPI